jgi:hypothetical protein
MTPLLKKHDYQSRPLLNPAPGSMHIIDLIHSEQHYTSRTSDHVTGLLILASNMNKIAKVQACWFQVPFTIGVKLRKSLYKHEGHACLGPDGKAMRLGNRVFGAGDKLEAGAYSLTDIKGLKRARNFDTWLQGMLWRGEQEGSAKSDFALAGTEPPRRDKDGAIVPGPSASVEQSSRKRRSSSANTNPAKKSKLAAEERGQTRAPPLPTPFPFAYDSGVSC